MGLQRGEGGCSGSRSQICGGGGEGWLEFHPLAPQFQPHRLTRFSTPPPPPPAAHGLKFAQSKVAYHSKEIEGVAGRYANPPVAVKESVGQVMDAIRAKFPSV